MLLFRRSRIFWWKVKCLGNTEKSSSYFFLFVSFIIVFNSSSTNFPHHIETSQLICIADQLTGLSMRGNIGRYIGDNTCIQVRGKLRTAVFVKTLQINFWLLEAFIARIILYNAFSFTGLPPLTILVKMFYAKLCFGKRIGF